MTHAVAIGLVFLAAGGCLTCLVTLVVVRRWPGAPEAAREPAPGVTLLKPLRGAEPGLEEKLGSFCDQTYCGPVQILFGVQEARDAAVAVVERLIASRPQRDLQLVVSTRPAGPNPKVATLIGLQPHIRHPLVVLSDSDVSVDPDYLVRTTAALAQPGVGLVTCLYRGVAAPGLWSRLGSMAVDYQFLPDVLLGLALGLARPCFGATIALRRDTLERIGGFEAFVTQLADDYAIGAAVRATGLSVAIPRWVLAHACPETTLAELWTHQLRWARTLRAVNALGYAGRVITNPLPLALLAACLGGLAPFTLAAVAAALLCRLVLQLQVEHTLRVNTNRWWLGPAGDLLAFAVFVASYFVEVVSWRGRRYRVRADGTLVPLAEPKA